MTHERNERSLTPYWCLQCNDFVWLRRMLVGHHHEGISTEGLFYLAKPVGDGSNGIAIRPLKNGKWRAVWLVEHQGYADHDCWGHTAGAMSHQHVRTPRRLKDGKFQDFATKEEAVATLGDPKWVDENLESEPDVECHSGSWG